MGEATHETETGASLLLLIGSVVVMSGVADVFLRLMVDSPREMQDECTRSKRRLYRDDCLLGWRAAHPTVPAAH